jgi:hypothetical protein
MPFKVLLRLCAQKFATKSGTTWSQKNSLLYVVPLGISNKLWIPFTDQMSEIRHFSVSIYCLILSGTSSRDAVHTDSCRYSKYNQHLSLVRRLWKPFPSSFSRTSNNLCESVTLSAFELLSRECGTQHKLNFSRWRTLCRTSCRMGNHVAL